MFNRKVNSDPIIIDDPSAENNVPATHVIPIMEQQLTIQTKLDDESINLALIYLRKQHSPRKGFEDITVGYAGKFSWHGRSFYQIRYVNHHCITVYSTKRNEV